MENKESKQAENTDQLGKYLRDLWQKMFGQLPTDLFSKKLCQRCGKSKQQTTFTGFLKPALFNEWQVCKQCKKDLEKSNFSFGRQTEQYYVEALNNIHLFSLNLATEAAWQTSQKLLKESTDALLAAVAQAAEAGTMNAFSKLNTPNPDRNVN